MQTQTNEATCNKKEYYNHTEGGGEKRTNLNNFGKQQDDWLL